MFGLSQQQVSKIANGQRWSCEIDDPEKFEQARKSKEAESERKAIQVKKLLSESMTQRDIAKTVGVSHQQVSLIKSGKVLKYLYL